MNFFFVGPSGDNSRFYLCDQVPTDIWASLIEGYLHPEEESPLDFGNRWESPGAKSRRRGGYGGFVGSTPLNCFHIGTWRVYKTARSCSSKTVFSFLGILLSYFLKILNVATDLSECVLVPRSREGTLLSPQHFPKMLPHTKCSQNILFDYSFVLMLPCFTRYHDDVKIRLSIFDQTRWQIWNLRALFSSMSTRGTIVRKPSVMPDDPEFHPHAIIKRQLW